MSWILTTGGAPDHHLIATLAIAGIVLCCGAAIGLAVAIAYHLGQPHRRPDHDWDIPVPTDGWDDRHPTGRSRSLP